MTLALHWTKNSETHAMEFPIASLNPYSYYFDENGYE